MPYSVPQFIKEETKLIGFSFTQLTILVCLGGLILLLFYTVQMPVFLILTAILLPSGLALALGKINETPIYKLVGPMFRYLWLPKQYIWNKEQVIQQKTASLKKNAPKTTESVSSTKRLDTETLKKLTDTLNQ